MSLDSYSSLNETKIEVSPVLEWQFSRFLSSIRRKLIFKQKFKNPWMVEISENIHFSIYYQFYRAVRDHSSAYGRVVETIKNKKGVTTQLVIAFSHLGTLKYHLSKVSKIKNVAYYFSKTHAVNGCKAKVEVSAENPVTFIYTKSKHCLVITAHYTIHNKYGSVCSF